MKRVEIEEFLRAYSKGEGNMAPKETGAFEPGPIYMYTY
jgi:hypothetical protein